MTSGTPKHLAGTDPTAFDAIIVGAGFAGLYMLHRLRGLGFRVRAYEAGSGVGGTWFWNRYPGARCDVESLEYSYSFSEDLQQAWRWPDKYSDQPQILRYLQHVAERFDLNRDIQLDTRIVAQTFDADRDLWVVDTDAGERILARYCVMASGNLSTPRVPDFPGLDRFQGAWYHSAMWPVSGVDFTGKRVGIVGTGSTGIQMIPKIAAQAAHLHVFQRTPNFSVPAWNSKLDPAVERAHKADYGNRRAQARQTSFGISGIPHPTQSALEPSPEARQQHLEDRWAAGGSVNFLTAYTDLLLDSDANEVASEFVRRKIFQTVRDPETARLLAPTDHPIGTKRLCVDTGYFETYNRDNVTLVDVRHTPIQEITAGGIRVDGTEYALDAIVFATGFDAMTGALREIDIRGMGGLPLRDKWTHGPTTLLGLMVAGFPNMFLITGPGSPSVKTNMVSAIEQHVDWIAECLDYLRLHGRTRIEPQRQAEQDWVAHVNDVADRTLYPQADSWYSGSNIPGKPRVFMPYVAGLHTYRAKCDEIAAQGYSGFTLSATDARPDETKAA